MSSDAGTLTLDSTTLYTTALNSLPGQSSSHSNPPPVPLPPIPPSVPQPKLIPKTRFIIDGFKYAGDFSVSYFLSHFHSDHYTDLSPNWSKGIIFCSSITANLLIQVLNVPAQFVVFLPLSEAVLIDGSEELNIGVSTVIAALEEACGTKRSKVRELYNSLGDLGDVAQLCRQTQSLLAPPVALTIRGVYSTLRRISLQAGSGSGSERKASLSIACAYVGRRR